MFTKVILENSLKIPHKILQTPYKLSTLKQPIQFSQTIWFLAALKVQNYYNFDIILAKQIKLNVLQNSP